MNARTPSPSLAYAEAVRAALADLPDDAARALVDGLDDHLAEIVAEGSTDLEAILGSPQSYATELRASLGSEGSRVVQETTAREPLAPPSGDPVEPSLSVADTAADIAVPDTEAADRADDALAAEATQPATAPTAVHRSRSVADRIGPNRVAVAARLVLIATFAILAIVAIRATSPVNAAEVLFGCVVVGGALAGERVTYIESGPDTVADRSILPVPDVVGMPLQAATESLIAMGFSVDIRGTDGLTVVKPFDVVAASDPLAFTEAPEGSTIVLYAGTGNLSVTTLAEAATPEGSPSESSTLPAATVPATTTLATSTTAEPSTPAPDTVPATTTILPAAASDPPPPVGPDTTG